MKKILLVGNPNVGKSVMFNRLSGAGVVVSNYPGTTVDYTKSRMRVGGKEYEIMDLPGTFSLEPKDKAEEVACKMLEESKPHTAAVIDVIDAKKYPVIVALNMSDAARDRKIKIDVEKLERILGVPVVETIATTGMGLKELISKIGKAKPADIEIVKKRLGR